MTDGPPSSASFQGEITKTRIEAFYRAAHDRSRFVIDFALLGLRSLVLVNGGAIVAMLTYLGHYQVVSLHTSLWVGFTLLLLGLGVALVTNALAYISQQHFTLHEHHSADQLYFNASESHDQEAESRGLSARHFAIGKRFQYPAIVAAFVSFGFFALGCVFTLSALAHTRP